MLVPKPNVPPLTAISIPALVTDPDDLVIVKEYVPVVPACNVVGPVTDGVTSVLCPLEWHVQPFVEPGFNVLPDTPLPVA